MARCYASFSLFPLAPLFSFPRSARSGTVFPGFKALFTKMLWLSSLERERGFLQGHIVDEGVSTVPATGFVAREAKGGRCLIFGSFFLFTGCRNTPAFFAFSHAYLQDSSMLEGGRQCAPQFSAKKAMKVACNNLLHVGKSGLTRPAKMCLTPTGNLLVYNLGNGCVQELTGLGDVEPQHVRFIPAPNAMSIALHGDALAVGTSKGTIELLSYPSGALIRSICARGSGPGQIGGTCSGLRFTPDGQFIIAAEFSNRRLSMFRVSDGGFVKHIGAGVVADGWKDVHFAPNGELLVADWGNHAVRVFDSEGDTLLRTWGSCGSALGQFEYPIALAIADSKLFVLDCNTARVQVFE
jgi:hypothetical protein